MSELKPCPFCGGEAEIEQQGTARQSHVIACTDCGARLETGEVWNAGHAWNTRPQPTASVDAEPVAFLYVDDDGNAAFEHSRSSRYPYWAETPLYTEAQMQARADAARREALEQALWATRSIEVPKDGVGPDRIAAWCLAIDVAAQAIRALKENPNAE